MMAAGAHSPGSCDDNLNEQPLSSSNLQTNLAMNFVSFSSALAETNHQRVSNSYGDGNGLCESTATNMDGSQHHVAAGMGKSNAIVACVDGAHVAVEWTVVPVMKITKISDISATIS
ncbi:hypothetical protein ACH5RR_017963 [Cinchona calisaya]|uniref:Uncharacterized protein n=1 Tax=Cinchona calisaya TaxID=153742 RepID=A0ABD2ZL14_9GENT